MTCRLCVITSFLFSLQAHAVFDDVVALQDKIDVSQVSLFPIPARNVTVRSLLSFHP